MHTQSEEEMMAKENLKFGYCKKCAKEYGLGERVNFEVTREDKCDLCHDYFTDTLYYMYFTEAMEKSLKYRTALQLIESWGNWNPEEVIPKGWPRREDGKTPYTPHELVKETLEERVTIDSKGVIHIGPRPLRVKGSF